LSRLREFSVITAVPSSEKVALKSAGERERSSARLPKVILALSAERESSPLTGLDTTPPMSTS